MNAKQKNKHAMGRTCKLYLEENAAITSQFAEYDEEKSGLDSDMGETEAVITQLEHENKGVALDKSALRKTAIGKGIKLGKKLTIFAKRRKNMELEKAVNTSQLNRLSDEDLPGKLTDLINLGTEYQAEAEQFGVTSILLGEASTANTAYLNAIPLPRISTSDVARLNARLKELQKSSDAHFDVIDAMVDAEKETQPDFWKGYFNARKIVDIGGRHLSMKIQVNEAGSGTGLYKVMLEFEQVDAGGKIMHTQFMKSVKYTGEKGGAMVRSLEGGTYELTVSKAGYATQTLTVYVTEGEMTNVKVELVKM